MTADDSNIEHEEKTGTSVTDWKKSAPRIVKTDGFERLFAHYTGLHGDALLQYLQKFQARALKV